MDQNLQDREKVLWMSLIKPRLRIPGIPWPPDAFPWPPDMFPGYIDWIDLMEIWIIWSRKWENIRYIGDGGGPWSVEPVAMMISWQVFMCLVIHPLFLAVKVDLSHPRVLSLSSSRETWWQTDRQTYLSPESYLTVPNIRAAHLWHLDKLVQYGTICLDKLYHIGTFLSRQIVPYWYTFV